VNEPGPEPETGSIGTIERFFATLSARDWKGLAAVLAPDVERIGPFGDRVSGRERYVDLLRGVVPSAYGNDVHRVTYAPDRRAGFARVTEHLTYPDQELHLEEAYAFGLDDDGLLALVEIFFQTPDADPGGFGSATSAESYASEGGRGPDGHGLPSDGRGA
jgi:ketosteroid isomerase-like protein